MGRFRIQLFLDTNSWPTIYNIPQNNQFSSGSAQWHLFDMDITQEKYGVRFIYDQLPSVPSNMSFSNIKLTHSV